MMSKITYSAINIGPIIKTLSMARKPRELWAASYLFSALMKRIVDMLSAENVKVISPTRVTGLLNGVGLYPDRVYFEGPVDKEMVYKVLADFVKDVNEKGKLNVKSEYFNIMISECSSEYFENNVIETLNHDLDIQELFVKAVNPETEDAIIELMLLKGKSPLLEKEEDEKAVKELKHIAKHILDKEKSYSKYFCVVQADGDNMGKSIISAKKEDLSLISSAMLQFGKEASERIKGFSDGSLPLYAGGDDLLFIVPVIGNNNRTVFDLVDDIDDVFRTTVQKEIAKALQPHLMVMQDSILHASMSYGIAISYYKYPLYEALESARKQLFDVAKRKVPGKNAVAVDFRKHSGGAFAFACTKNKNNLIYDSFKELICKSGVEQSVVSAVAHKLRNNKDLLGLWFESDNYYDRNLNFFTRFIEYTAESSEKENVYKKVVLKLLNALFADRENVIEYNKEKDKDKQIEYNIDVLIKNIYAMLRTAKFMKGEPVHE